MSLPDLITLARATQNASLAALNASNASYLASLITAASDAIRRKCGRDFSLVSYTEYHSGSAASEAGQPLRLRQFPVVEITRIATRPLPALRVQNVDAVTNQRATVETLSTGLRLLRVASGVASTTDLLFATYPTLGALAAQVNTIGSGWAASVYGGFTNWSSADLKPLQGAATAVMGGADLEMYTEDLNGFPSIDAATNAEPLSSTGWRLDEETGELFARFPRGRLNLRIDYQAGFATIPQPIQEACVQLVQDLYNAGLVNSTLKKATLGSSSFEVKDQQAATKLSGKVMMLLAPYIDHAKTMAR